MGNVSEVVCKKSSVVASFCLAVEEEKASVLVEFHADLIARCRVKEGGLGASFHAEGECGVQEVLAEARAAQAVEHGKAGDIENFVHILQIFVGLFREVEAFDIICDLERDGADGHVVPVEKAEARVGLQLLHKILDALMHRVQDRGIDAGIVAVSDHRGFYELR